VTTPADEVEFTELVDANFPTVALVGKGANGVPKFLIAKQDGDTAGLLEPGFVRDLIAKSEPGQPGREQVTMPPGVTLSGSPADIAAFIHKAAQRGAPDDVDTAEAGEAARIAKARADYDQVIKAKYNADDLKRMAGNGEAMDDGSYPIGDKEDLGKAIKAVGRGGADHNAIRRHVIKRAKALGASSEIPDNWNADGSLKEGPVAKSDPVSKDMGPDLDDGVDGLDPTIPLAAPEDDNAPGDPTDPGSPAWEAIDAATASKWTSILSRAGVAISILAERELLEAASADPDDMDNAWDLQDVGCAIDYAISVLAPFAVAEQSEADCGTDAMAAIGKAMARFDALPMARIETLSYVAKAGRVLSAANESEIRTAAASLQKVLTSLPAAPVADDSGQLVAKEGSDMPQDNKPAEPVGKASSDDQARNTGPVNAGGTTGMGEPRVTGPDAALPADGPQQSLPGDVPGRQVIKAAIAAVFDENGRLIGVTDPAAIVQRVEKDDGEKPPMQAVFDQNGDLIGIVSPDAIQPVTGAGKKPDAGDAAGAGDGKDGDAKPAAAAADLDPAPAADVGTPSGGVATDDDVAKGAAAADGTQDVITVTRDVLKSIAQDAAATALEAQGAAHQEVIAKMAADNGEMAEELRVVKARLETVENEPAASKVFTNGQVPPAQQMRGQDQGSPPVDVAKAAELRHTLYNGSGPEQAEAFHQMEGMAIAKFAQIRGGAQQSPAAPR
jgi:hypothetical protein